LEIGAGAGGVGADGDGRIAGRFAMTGRRVTAGRAGFASGLADFVSPGFAASFDDFASGFAVVFDDFVSTPGFVPSPLGPGCPAGATPADGAGTTILGQLTPIVAPTVRATSSAIGRHASTFVGAVAAGLSTVPVATLSDAVASPDAALSDEVVALSREPVADLSA
jgi:hypothetical protein